MTSTLIVRDATLAINGAPDRRVAPRDHLQERLAEVAGFDDAFVRECLEVIGPTVGSVESDPEALQAAVLLGLAKPETCAQLGVSTIAVGRRLAARLEKEGQSERALALLELLVAAHPGHKALERDLAGMMRRQGMVHELVERYLERARQLLKEGRTAEAIAWMREVLLLDRSRKDVARTIRDLRFQEIDKSEGRRHRLRTAVVTLLLSTVVTVVALREKRLADEYAALPPAGPGDLVALRERLAGVEAFIDGHPVWHGGLDAIRERTRLRLQVERIEEDRRLAREKTETQRRQRLETAEIARQRGMQLAETGDYAGAMEEFRRSLSLAPSDWSKRERVERDVSAIAEYLEEGR